MAQVQEPQTLEALVADTQELVSPPHVCLRVIEAVQSGEADAQQFANIIREDPALTARVLRVVNSAFYNLKSRVDTISRAVAVLGLRELYSVVIGLNGVRVFSNIPGDLIDMNTFWRHSVYAGLAARAISKKRHVLHPERLFVAGLLHDVGSLVLYNRKPQIMRELLSAAEGDEATLATLEWERLGFSHEQLGASLLEQWELPASLREGIAQHHHPDEGNLEADIVYLADSMANRTALSGSMGQRSGGTDPVVPGEGAMARLELDSEALAEILDEVADQFVDTLGSMVVDSATIDE